MAGYEQLQAGIREHRRRDEAEAGDASRELEANVNHERFVDEDGNLQRQPLQHVHGGPRMTTRYSTLVQGPAECGVHDGVHATSLWPTEETMVQHAHIATTRAALR